MASRIIRNNSLSFVMFGLFLVFLAGQSVTGLREFNAERRERRLAEFEYGSYIRSGHFVEAVFENWESEFLQMACYVLLTVFLRQKGSAESKPINEKRREPVSKVRTNSPWPVRRGGWILRFYEYSLSAALFALFVVSFFLHAVGGLRHYNLELEDGRRTATLAQHITTSRFWFESLQNWQSEFLSVGVLVVLSIYLRQRGSPESKPVESPHTHTGK